MSFKIQTFHSRKCLLKLGPFCAGFNVYGTLSSKAGQYVCVPFVTWNSHNHWVRAVIDIQLSGYSSSMVLIGLEGCWNWVPIISTDQCQSNRLQKLRGICTRHRALGSFTTPSRLTSNTQLIFAIIIYLHIYFVLLSTKYTALVFLLCGTKNFHRCIAKNDSDSETGFNELWLMRLKYLVRWDWLDVISGHW